MARINIEDTLFKDPRWEDLLLKVGCKYKALGFLTRSWIIAQDHWLEFHCIPQKAWPKELDILIEVELAERLESGDVYIKGSKKAFSWLDQKSNAGKALSLKKLNQLENARQKNSERTLNGAERTLNGDCTGLNGSEALTLTLTHTLNNNINNNINNNTIAPSRENTPRKQQQTVVFDWPTISEEAKKNWLENYNQEFIDRELPEVKNWLIANPQKNKKTPHGWILFLGNWFRRGWPSYQKSIPTKQATVGQVSPRVVI